MSQTSKPLIYDLSKDELTALIERWGYPSFRADQVWGWLYRAKATSYKDMRNIPADLKDQLAAGTRVDGLTIVNELVSSDGETRKLLLSLNDGQLIETVLMEYDGQRRTACISTQAGCAMACVFCATGQMGFARNLSSGEIVAQAIFIARHLEAANERLSNVVLMGMGEPFHNYNAVLLAVRRMIDPLGLGIGQRHITISTVGLVPAIHKFAEEGLQTRLAISLHASTDEERSALLPVNKRYPLAEVIAAAKHYSAKTGRRVTFEWALIDGENDTSDQAERLGALLEGMLCHVNLIPLNPTGGYVGRRPNEARIDQFMAVLKQYGIPVTVRVRRGIDIDAGCGQLKADVLGLSQH